MSIIGTQIFKGKVNSGQEPCSQNNAYVKISCKSLWTYDAEHNSRTTHSQLISKLKCYTTLTKGNKGSAKRGELSEVLLRLH